MSRRAAGARRPVDELLARDGPGYAGRPRTTPAPQPAPFLLCVEDFDRKDGRVWAVKQGPRWRYASDVVVQVTVETVFRGKHAAQPKAYLQGVGVVRCLERGRILITA